MPVKHPADNPVLKATNPKNMTTNAEPAKAEAAATEPNNNNNNNNGHNGVAKCRKTSPMESANNNVASIYRLLLDELPAKVCRVRFFANGDRFFPGLSYVVNLERIRTLDLLCADLSRLLVNLTSLPSGVRIIFRCDDGKKIETIQQLKANGNYVCSSTEHLVRLPYTQLAPRPATVVVAAATAVSAIESRGANNGGGKLSHAKSKGNVTQSMFAPSTLPAPAGGGAAASRANKRSMLASSTSSTMTLSSNATLSPACLNAGGTGSSTEGDYSSLTITGSISFRPKIVALLRGACRGPPSFRPTRRVFRFLVTPRIALNFEQLLNEISKTVNMYTGAVHNVYAFATGRKISTPLDFCDDESIYLVYGRSEKCSHFDYLLDEDEHHEIQLILGLNNRFPLSNPPKLSVWQPSKSAKARLSSGNGVAKVTKKNGVAKAEGKKEGDAKANSSPGMFRAAAAKDAKKDVTGSETYASHQRYVPANISEDMDGIREIIERFESKNRAAEAKKQVKLQAQVEFDTPTHNAKAKKSAAADDEEEEDLHTFNSPKSMINLDDKYWPEDFSFKTSKTNKKVSTNNNKDSADRQSFNADRNQDLIDQQLIPNLGSMTTASSLSTSTGASSQSLRMAADLKPKAEPLSIKNIDDMIAEIKNMAIYKASMPQSSKENSSASSSPSSTPKSSLGGASKNVKNFQPNKEVDRFYEVGDAIGDGKFGVVYKCTKRSSGQKFALKVVNKLEMQQMLPNSCSDEGKILEKIHHPNIIRLYQSFDFFDETYLVLELFKDGDLFDAITLANSYPELEAAKMIYDLVQAVAYLHKHHIIHRDIKLENLMVTRVPMVDPVTREERTRLQVKLADFGLAVQIFPDEKLFTVCGTPTYVAPEILLETGYSYPVDIWACGVIAFILLSGYPPFANEDNNQDLLFDQILAGRFDFDHPNWEAVSAEAKQLISFMLNVNSELRLSPREVLSHDWVEKYNGPHTDP